MDDYDEALTDTYESRRRNPVEELSEEGNTKKSTSSSESAK